MNAYEQMREALTSIREMVTTLSGYCSPKMTTRIFVIAQRALAAPARNCDVGTAEEQGERFAKFCKREEHGFGASAYCAYSCSCGETVDCKFAWAQMPYTAEGATA